MADATDALPGWIETAPAAGHFRNGRFFNPGVAEHAPGDLLRWMRGRKPGSWRRWIASRPGPKPPARVDGASLRATFVNHSTVLLQTEGLNILTDPVWSYRISPVGFAGPARHRDPGIRFDDLPAIDCILISHNHYDHFDVSTLRLLAARNRDAAVFCPLGLEQKLRRIGFSQVQELDWWQTQPWRGMQIHCVPAQHFSARTPFDRNRTLWCGWMMEGPHGNLYFAGDTGFGGLFAAIRERFPAVRLALLPIGAYEPEWFMGPVHMTPEQAIAARAIVNARSAMGIHFGTFALADDSETGPVERLRQALQGREDAGQFLVLEEGEGRSMP
jgi:L-ascorbate metabolism protein UlaG (beta-lactamase superfamily)